MSPPGWRGARAAGFAAAMVLALAACGAGRAPTPAADPQKALSAYQARAERLSDLEGWRLRGRVTVESGRESGQVRVRWSRTGNRGRLGIRNPFGQTLMVLTHGPGELRLRDREGRTFHANQARAVLRERLGAWVPVKRFSSWALGLSSPPEQAPPDLDRRGLPVRLDLGGWSVTYGAYRRVEGVWLPATMEIRGQGTRLRIRVDDWRLDWKGPTDQGGQA